MFQSPMGGAFHALAPDSMVDKPAMLIPAKLIPENAPPIKSMKPLPVNVVGIFPASHSEKPLMEVVVVNKCKNAFAEAKIKINSYPDPIKHERTVHKNCSYRQRCPTNGRIHFRMTPKDPGRPPFVVRCPEPTPARHHYPTTIVKRDVS